MIEVTTQHTNYCVTHTNGPGLSIAGCHATILPQWP